MQRRSISRTDPRYNQVRAKNNDSVKKSREKSRRERDETISSINALEAENEDLIEKLQKLKNEYQQLKDLFHQYTGISFDQMATSESSSTSQSTISSSIEPTTNEQIQSSSLEPIRTVNRNEIKIDSTPISLSASTTTPELDVNDLDGAIVLINGVQYKIMNSSVNIFILLLSMISFLVLGQDTSSTDKVKTKKQDFYCSACQSMSETIFREIKNADPNERVQVGSYRVDGHGHQKLKEVPIIETRFHIENVLENICSKSINGQQTIPSTLRNIHEHACDDILEEHHDNLIDLLLQQSKNIESAQNLANLFCVETNDYCKANQLDELFKSKRAMEETNDDTEDKQQQTDDNDLNEKRDL